MKLNEIMKRYREDHELSQRQLAEKCGLSNGYISILERDEPIYTGKPVTPTLTVLLKIAKGLDMTLDELLREAEDMPVSLSFRRDELSEKETQLVSYYIQLNDTGKELLLNMAKTLYDSGRFNKSSKGDQND